MKRFISTALFVLALGSMGCKSTLHGTVQVYTGNLDSVQTLGSALTDLHVARNIAEKTQTALSTAITNAETASNSLKAASAEAKKTFQTIKADPTYEKTFVGYRDAWAAYATAVGKSNAKTAKELFEDKDVLKSISDVRAQLNGKIAEKFEKRILAPSFSGELQKNAESQDDELSLFVALNQVAGFLDGNASAPNVDNLQPEQRALFVDNKADKALANLAATLKKTNAPSNPGIALQAEVDKYIDDLANRVKSVKDTFQDRVLGAWKETDKAMLAAEKALVEARPNATEAKKPEIEQKARDATALVTAHLGTYADELDSIHTQSSSVASDSNILGRYFASQGVSSVISQLPDLANIQKNIKALREVTEKSSDQIRGAKLKLVGEPGFDATDPNVPKLDENKWSEKFVDEFEVEADGESEFVIVQESPTRFNVKQLRFDPKSNAQLGMAFADLGFDIATSVLQQTTGVKLDVSSTGTTSEVSGDARKRIADDCRASLRAMSGTLKTELGKIQQPGAVVDQAVVGRVRGLLQGHHALLSACTAALGKTSPTTPAAK